jgi:hypothetical protein
MREPVSPAGFEKLRAETAHLLGIDLTADLPLAESLRLDCIALLRLEVDGLQGKALSGEEVDLARLGAALSMLTKLLPEAELKAEPQVARGEGRERLRQLIEQTVIGADTASAEAEASRKQLEAEVEQLRSELLQARTAPTTTTPAARSVDVVPLRPAPATQQAASDDGAWWRWYSSGGDYSTGRNIQGIPRDF